MLTLANRSFNSRLILGTARYSDQETLLEAIKLSEAEIVTVSIRRLSEKGPSFSRLLEKEGLMLLPNTAGCNTAREAVLTAQMAQEAL